MRTIAVTNQKGGCGKTTTAVNLAAAFAEEHYRTLLIDLDPQGHSTIGFGYDPDQLENTMYDVMVNRSVGIGSITIATKIDSLDLAPSNVLLSVAELDLAGVFGRELALRDKLWRVRDEYDICLIDCPPSLGLLTLNGLLASTGVIIPVQTQYYATEGLKQIFKAINVIEGRLSPGRLTILGVLLTLVENTTLLGRQVQQQMRDVLGSLVFKTAISKNVRLAEAPSIGEPILTYSPKSKSSTEYRALAKEITDKWALLDAIKTLVVELNNEDMLVGR